MANEKTYGPEPVKTKDVPTPTPAALPRTPREALERERAHSKHPPVFVEASLPGDFDEPFKVAEPRELTPAEQEVKKQKDELVKQISEILGKFDHRESNIPANHEYWGLVAKYRAL